MFYQLIDWVRRCWYCCRQTLIDPKACKFSTGSHHLTGEQALAYTRSRSTELGDIGRIQRQQYIFRELLNQKLNLQTVSKILIISTYWLKTPNRSRSYDYSILCKGSSFLQLWKYKCFYYSIPPDWIENGTISFRFLTRKNLKQCGKG